MTLKPAADGTIMLQAGPGTNNDNSTGFYYLGALMVSYDLEDTPPPPPPPPAGPDELDTVLVDFGGSSLSPAPWNNVTDPEVGAVADLQNSRGLQTGYGLNIFDGFNNINTNGTQNPNPDLDLPAAATGDSFFGNVTEFGGQTEPTAGVELTGLKLDKTYTWSCLPPVAPVTTGRPATSWKGLPRIPYTWTRPRTPTVLRWLPYSPWPTVPSVLWSAPAPTTQTAQASTTSACCV